MHVSVCPSSGLAVSKAAFTTQKREVPVSQRSGWKAGVCNLGWKNQPSKEEHSSKLAEMWGTMIL